MTAKPASTRSATTSAPPRPCPVCGDGARLSHLCDVDGYRVLACARCGAEHATPVPTPAELKAFYDRPEWFEGGERGGYENYDSQSSASEGLVASILDRFAGRENPMVLDVGCGYGTHLKLAAERGWMCLGVELSDHARAKAKERLGPKAYIVGSFGELFSHEVDVVLMLDVIEHVPSPYALLYQLFSLGIITAKTTVVIATPNAGSDAARRDPAAWAYRHPPSHLVYYTADALTYLLRRLQFTSIDVRGSDTDDVSKAAGLLAIASGSGFMQFMHERYVPGTWSKIAEYEHMPRYALAADLAQGKAVLDFGCGTGYGAAMVAGRAKAVTGLDIDAGALAWAREVHRNANLTFVQSADLGAGLPPVSFDLVTCFEMIEHVDHATQQSTVASIARVLKPGGVLVMSTPNPEVTKFYDANPYHIREMTEAKFRELLAPHFPNIEILRQHLQPAVAFDRATTNVHESRYLNAASGGGFGEPLAFIAVCSRGALPAVADRAYFDAQGDYVEQFVVRERHLNLARFEAFRHGARAQELDEKVATLYGYLNDLNADRDAVKLALANAVAERAAIAADSVATKAHLAEVLADRAAVVADRDAIQADREAVKQDRDAIIADRAAVVAHRDAVVADNAKLHGDLSMLSQRYVDLAALRDQEHRSVRFLARQLWRATKMRLKQKFGGQKT
ncbi:MAG: methyltransferase domain-containing protein [Rhodospirillaceae bacterium]|nr:methyltransferase domain-containing protein [Rhodospirillaceae bacterium]